MTTTTAAATAAPLPVFVLDEVQHQQSDVTAPAPEMFAAPSDDALDAVLSSIEENCIMNTAKYVAMTPGDCGNRQLPATTQPFVQRWGDNDREPVTFFHSSAIPPFGLSFLVKAVQKRYGSYSNTSAMQALALMVRFSDASGLPMTHAMMHRAFLTSLLVVGKVHHDRVPRTREFAETIGLAVREVIRLEKYLVDALSWRALVTGSDLQRLATRCAMSSPRVGKAFHVSFDSSRDNVPFVGRKSVHRSLTALPTPNASFSAHMPYSCPTTPAISAGVSASHIPEASNASGLPA